MNLLSTGNYPKITLKNKQEVGSIEKKQKINKDSSQGQSFSQYLESSQKNLNREKEKQKKDNEREINSLNSELILYNKSGKDNISQIRPSFDMKL